jgi:enoyl-CoA hydratase
MEGAFGSSFLRWETRDGAAWLTIDRVQCKNAMSLEMYRGVRRAVAAADEDPSIGVLVVTGVDDVFCVGGGMTAEVLFEDPGSWPGMGYVPTADGGTRAVDPQETPVDIEREVLPFEAVTSARVTVISSVNGLCMGGGFILALASDITLASDNAVLWTPELLRGVPDPWLPAMLPAYVGLERAKFLMMTAPRFDARQAAAWGIVSEVVPPEELRQRTAEVVDQVLQTAPVARGIYKSQANRYLAGLELDVVRAQASEEEKLEGFRAFALRRTPSWVPPARRDPGC